MAGPTRSNPSWDGQTPYPSYDSTSANAYNPQVYSSLLVDQLYAASVFGDISSTAYEGEIKSHGDTVVIRTVPTIAVSDYTVGAGLTYEVPSNPKVELNIDVAKSFSVQVNDIDAVQSDINILSRWMEAAGEELKVANDRHHLAALLGQADAANRGATAGVISGDLNLGVTTAPVVVTAANVIETILDAGLALDEQNVQTSDRWIVLPSWACMLIKRSALADANYSGDSVSIARNGLIGTIDRFKVYASNLLPNPAAGEFAAFAGVDSGIAFASQIVKSETMKNPSDFGELLRGLQVSGSKVVKAEKVVELVISK